MTRTLTTTHVDPPGAITPYAVAPPTPGWWERNWKWAVPVGTSVLILAVVASIAALIAIVFGVLRSTEVYRTAVTEARREPAVIAALGVPIEEGFLVSGNIEVSPGSGYANLAIPIKGPSGRAVIVVEAEKSRGEWVYSTLDVALAGGAETIDLLEYP